MGVLVFDEPVNTGKFYCRLLAADCGLPNEVANLRKTRYVDVTHLDELVEKIKLHHYEKTKELH